MKCSLFPFFFGYSLGGGISGRVRALNLTVPLGYGPGSGFSFEPVQTSKRECLRADAKGESEHCGEEPETLLLILIL